MFAFLLLCPGWDKFAQCKTTFKLFLRFVKTSPALCLVTSYAGVPQPTSVNVGGISVPAHLDQAGLQSWLLQHPQQAANGFPLGPAGATQIRSAIDQNIASLYGDYSANEIGGSNPAAKEMAKIGLEIIVTPILANHVIPYFLDGQRLVVGLAMDQLRPAALAPGTGGGPGGPGRVLLGGRGALGIPPMPTWAMISVGIVGWSVIGAWRMITRDA